jgi:hypothetical protein
MRVAGVLIARPIDMRTAARTLWPHNKSMQRKWLHAWRTAPGARVPIGTHIPEEYLARARVVAHAYIGAIKPRAVSMHLVEPLTKPAPKADRIRRVI